MALKEKREEKGVSRMDVAKALDVDVSTVTRWEIGRVRPASKHVRKLCLFFNCSADELWPEAQA